MDDIYKKALKTKAATEQALKTTAAIETKVPLIPERQRSGMISDTGQMGSGMKQMPTPPPTNLETLTADEQDALKTASASRVLFWNVILFATAALLRQVFAALLSAHDKIYVKPRKAKFEMETTRIQNEFNERQQTAKDDGVDWDDAMQKSAKNQVLGSTIARAKRRAIAVSFIVQEKLNNTFRAFTLFPVWEIGSLLATYQGAVLSCAEGLHLSTRGFDASPSTADDWGLFMLFLGVLILYALPHIVAIAYLIATKAGTKTDENQAVQWVEYGGERDVADPSAHLQASGYWTAVASSPDFLGAYGAWFEKFNRRGVFFMVVDMTRMLLIGLIAGCMTSVSGTITTALLLGVFTVHVLLIGALRPYAEYKVNFTQGFTMLNNCLTLAVLIWSIADKDGSFVRDTVLVVISLLPVAVSICEQIWGISMTLYEARQKRMLGQDLDPLELLRAGLGAVNLAKQASSVRIAPANVGNMRDSIGLERVEGQPLIHIPSLLHLALLDNL